MTRRAYRRPRWIIAGFVIVALTMASLIGSGAPAEAKTTIDTSYVEGRDTQAFLFNPLTVNKFALTMAPADLAALNNEPRVYARASLIVTTSAGTTKSYAVGVRLKGMWGSDRRLDRKAAFKIKMNEYVAGQTLYGIKKFTLNNMVQDPTMLREAVAYRLFRAMGVPAPRVGYASVTLNGTNYGLHANIETYDDIMFSRWFSGGTKHLFEGGYGTEVGPEMQVDEGSKTDLTDVTELQAINNLSGEEWFNAVRTRVNLTEMIMDWAVEHYISHWDGYTRGWPNNYYVHRQKSGMFTMHPWGTDQTWNTDQQTPIIDNGATMMTRCIQYQPCNDLYVGALGRIKTVVPTLNLPAMVDEIWAKTATLVSADPLKEYTYDSAVYYKDLAKSYMAARISELTHLVGTRTTPALKVSYPTTGFKPGAIIRPTVTKAGNGVMSYVRLQGDGVCAVDSTTGYTLIQRPGTCQIGAQSSRTDSTHADMVTVTREVPMMTSRIIVAVYNKLPKAQVMNLGVTADSTNTVRAKRLSGSCRVIGLQVTALATSGICKITLSVSGDGIFFGTSRVISITMRRPIAPALI